jgi:hypothetical protein
MLAYIRKKQRKILVLERVLNYPGPRHADNPLPYQA